LRKTSAPHESFSQRANERASPGQSEGVGGEYAAQLACVQPWQGGSAQCSPRARNRLCL